MVNALFGKLTDFSLDLFTDETFTLHLLLPSICEEIS